MIEYLDKDFNRSRKTLILIDKINEIIRELNDLTETER